MITENAVIHPNVKLGRDCIIEDFAVIGAPVGGDEPYPETIIGDGAHIRSHTVIYAGNRIGKRFHTGNKANIREMNEIGDDVSIGTLSVIEHHVKIGNGVRIHSQVFVPEYSILEEKCWLGPNVVLTNAKYPNTPITKDQLNGVTIGSGASVGANSTLLPGIRIGDHALIGAGSVVTKDIGAQRSAVGNPARERGWVCECGIPLSGEPRMRCSVCESAYNLSDGKIERM